MKTKVKTLDKSALEHLKLEAEIARIIAETSRLKAEALKIEVEASKITRERWWYPIATFTAVLASAAVVKSFWI